MKFIQKYNIADFEEHKEELLFAIEEIVNLGGAHYANMSHSDYDMKSPNLYQDRTRALVEPYIQKYVDSWGCGEFVLNHFWFAQYENGGDFGWHTHEGCNLSAVLTVELPNFMDSTDIYGHIFDTKVVEGDLIIFPAMAPHRSPKVINGRKTVIGMNLSMQGSSLNS